MQKAPNADDDLPTWYPASADPALAGPPVSLGPGNVPVGGNLRLDIGWDAFEQLLTTIARHALGLNQIRFRRYGVPGQAQHGIDVAGRRPDGTYTIVQCKEVDAFTKADLRDAVEKFASGRRPFDAKHFIVAVSHPGARTTQVQEELALLQKEYRVDFELDLWGPEELNDVLRQRGDIVARFWTRETASTFCTGAPLPGVAAPPPEWTRVADQVLLSPIGVDGLDRDVAQAEKLEGDDPAAAAAAYGRIGSRLDAEGFGGHAHVMSRRQLDALATAGDFDAASRLAARLAAVALHEGDLHQARLLSHRLDTFVRQGRESGTEPSTETERHATLIQAAVDAAEHPLGNNDALLEVLRDAPDGMPAPEYQPMLVLLLAELTEADAVFATQTDRPAHELAEREGAHAADLSLLLVGALDQRSVAPAMPNDDLAMRLRMVRAAHDSAERVQLLAEARQMRLPRSQAALVLAAEARRAAVAGSSDDALEYWRQGIANAIHDGRTDDAAGWLYAIRAVHIRYGPWTQNIDEEHLLAQALPRSTSGRIIRRVRDPENDARRHALGDQPVEAIRSARRWLADSIVTGDWANEDAAVEMLGDLYAANAEPDRAAMCYQWAGKTKKLLQLAEGIGDHLLPQADLRTSPWWQREATLALIAAQRDLVPDSVAARLLIDLLDLVTRSRAGELIEGPTHSLSTQAAKTACALAARGTTVEARTLLDLLAGDVVREENQHRFHDEQHVEACLDIAAHHHDLAFVALSRVFDLAEVGTHDALRVLPVDAVLDWLRDTSARDGAMLASLEREQLRNRLRTMATAGRYQAGIAAAALGDADAIVQERAVEARDRLLARPEPDGHSASFGTMMVPDSYLVTFLSQADRRSCAQKLIAVAEDARETASNRQEALTAVCNLAADDDDRSRAEVHLRSRPFATGERDGSWLDDQTTHPHPLSTMKIDFGSSSLRPQGLRLAHFTAVTDDDRKWVRDHAIAMLGGNDEREIRSAAIVLAGMPADVFGKLDAALLAGHPLTAVRQLAVVAAMAQPAIYASTLHALTADPDRAVRVLLAQRLHEARTKERDGPESEHEQTTIDALLGTLANDVRHSVRRAAAGLDNG